MKKILAILSLITFITGFTTQSIACRVPNDNSKYSKFEFDENIHHQYFYDDIWIDDYTEIIKLLEILYPDLTFIKKSDLQSEQFKYSTKRQQIFVIEKNNFENSIFIEQYNSDDQINWNLKPSYITTKQMTLSIKYTEEKIIIDFKKFLKKYDNVLYSDINQKFIDFILETNNFNLSNIKFKFEIIDKTGFLIKDENTILDPKSLDILSIKEGDKSFNNMFYISNGFLMSKKTEINYSIKNLDHIFLLKYKSGDNRFWEKDFAGLKISLALKMQEQMKNDFRINGDFDFRKYFLNNSENLILEFKNDEGDLLSENNYNAQQLCENMEIYTARIELIEPIDNYYYFIYGVSNITLEFTL